MLILDVQCDFIIHKICMKTLNVYFHSVHLLNKPMFLNKKDKCNKCESFDFLPFILFTVFTVKKTNSLRNKTFGILLIWIFFLPL